MSDLEILEHFCRASDGLYGEQLVRNERLSRPTSAPQSPALRLQSQKK